MRIEIIEVQNRGLYDVFLNGEMICEETKTPMCSAARVLIARGCNPDDPFEKVRYGSDQVDMRSTIGKAAKLAVSEGNQRPRFVPFEPFPGRPVCNGDQ